MQIKWVTCGTHDQTSPEWMNCAKFRQACQQQQQQQTITEPPWQKSMMNFFTIGSAAVSFSRALFVIWLWVFLLPVDPMVKGKMAAITVTLFVWKNATNSEWAVCVFMPVLKTPALTALSGTLDKSIPEPGYMSHVVCATCVFTL